MSISIVPMKSHEKQIVSNMKKTDVDRDYYNFILHDVEFDKLLHRISKEFLYNTYNHF